MTAAPMTYSGNTPESTQAVMMTAVGVTVLAASAKQVSIAGEEDVQDGKSAALT